MKTTRRILKNKKGIDTILAALLMVVIVVVASVMVYAWSTGLLGTLLVTPNVGKEALNADSYSFGAGSPTNNVTIYIRNTGSVAVSLTTYYVKDSSNDAYTQSSWSGPSINPSAVQTATIIINNSCSGCTLSGSAFQFTSGTSYTVVVITSRNNQFSFTVTR